MYLKNRIIFFYFISLFRFVFYFVPSIFFISVYFVLFSLISFCFRWFRFISFSFHWFRFVSFRFVSFRFRWFRFVSFRFVSFLFRFALYRYPGKMCVAAMSLCMIVLIVTRKRGDGNIILLCDKPTTTLLINCCYQNLL